VERDGFFFLEALVEFIALEHLRDGELRSEADDAFEIKLVEPLGVEADLRLVAVEDAEDLVGVGLGVLVDLLAGERLAGDGAAGGVADQRREVADEEDDLVAEVLKVLELAHEHGVPEMEVRRGGVKASLDAERTAGGAGLLKALAEVRDADDFSGAFLQEVELFFDRGEGVGGIGHDLFSMRDFCLLYRCSGGVRARHDTQFPVLTFKQGAMSNG
jgi:hypothetical protein